MLIFCTTCTQWRYCKGFHLWNGLILFEYDCLVCNNVITCIPVCVNWHENNRHHKPHARRKRVSLPFRFEWAFRIPHPNALFFFAFCSLHFCCMLDWFCHQSLFSFCCCFRHSFFLFSINHLFLSICQSLLSIVTSHREKDDMVCIAYMINNNYTTCIASHHFTHHHTTAII